MFAEATMSAKSFERECSNKPPIGGINPPIAKDEIGPASLNPPTVQRNPLIKCKCTKRYL